MLQLCRGAWGLKCSPHRGSAKPPCVFGDGVAQLSLLGLVSPCSCGLISYMDR